MAESPRYHKGFPVAPSFALASAFLLAGCTPAPSVVLFGAAFPDWLLCAVTGMAGMVVVHLIVLRTRYHEWLLPAPVVYPCLTSLIAMFIWLLVFPN